MFEYLGLDSRYIRFQCTARNMLTSEGLLVFCLDRLSRTDMDERTTKVWHLFERDVRVYSDWYR